jgi:SAM-dependent methyltransferase
MQTGQCWRTLRLSSECLCHALDGCRVLLVAGLSSGLSWVQGNAQQLPFQDSCMDAYTVAFGIRNMTDRDAALSEAYRVLRRGGRLLCLEFSHVSLPVLKQAYDLYSFSVIPKIGGLVAGDEASYQYLVESIRQFPDQVRPNMPFRWRSNRVCASYPFAPYTHIDDACTGWPSNRTSVHRSQLCRGRHASVPDGQSGFLCRIASLLSASDTRAREDWQVTPSIYCRYDELDAG